METKNEITTVKSLLKKQYIQEKFKAILKDKADGFMANLAVMVNNSDTLQKCEPMSIVGAAVISASLNLQLDPNLGFAAVIPYGNKAQFQIQYKGFKQLAIRSGQFERIEWCKTYPSDTEEDIMQRLRSIRKKGKKGEPVEGYAHYFKLINSFESFFYMSVEDIERHAKRYSQSYKKGFGMWVDDFDKMAQKTVIKLHLKSGEAPMSIEMQKAGKFDQGIIVDEENVEYVDNEPEQGKADNPFSAKGKKGKETVEEKKEEPAKVEQKEEPVKADGKINFNGIK
jgi:recombination protein RecT